MRVDYDHLIGGSCEFLKKITAEEFKAVIANTRPENLSRVVEAFRNSDAASFLNMMRIEVEAQHTINQINQAYDAAKPQIETPIVVVINNLGALMAKAPALLAFAERSITDDCDCIRCEEGRALVKQARGE